MADETYIKVIGVWKYLYRTVEKEGKKIDFLLTERRDKAATMKSSEKAIHDNGTPEKVAMDKSVANKSAIDQIIEDKGISVIVRQVKYINNVVEQDHRAVKWITNRCLDLSHFEPQKNVLAGIELNCMIRKGQLNTESVEEISFDS